MSNVTDVLVTCDLMDDGCYADVGRRFAAKCDVAQFVRVDGSVVGHKACQAVVAIAAVNGWGLYEGVLKLALQAQPWRFPDAVKVFVHRENAEAFVELRWR
jgi:hypothetical protein